jgi:hypothetical protein
VFLKGLLRSTYDDDESMEWDEFLYLRRVCLKFGVSKEELLMLCRYCTILYCTLTVLTVHC